MKPCCNPCNARPSCLRLGCIVFVFLFLFGLMATMTDRLPQFHSPPVQICDVGVELEQSSTPQRVYNACGLATSNCNPKEHVYYLKTHKTGSTTVYSILAEYCRVHDLLPLLPSGVHINLSPPFRKSQVLLDPDIGTYDMVFNHHIFTPKILQYLHKDTYVFTTLREPFTQMVSSFQYFRGESQMPYLNRIKAADPLVEFLSNPVKYEGKGYSSYTNNRQSMDLGYDVRRSFTDIKYIAEFIALTNKRFDLVLITDYFHESLIILKRALGWKSNDILYYKKNARKPKNKVEAQNASLTIQRQQHAHYSLADISLYDFFLKKFKARMAQERDLQGEVHEFENVLTKVHGFCDNVKGTSKRLKIPAGRWTDPVNILRGKCQWLKLPEVPFTHYMKSRQRNL